MADSGTKTAAKSRKTLTDCFEEAISRIKTEVTGPWLVKHPKRDTVVTEFLKGAQLTDLEKVCQELSNETRNKANNAAKFLETLEQIKVVGDFFISSAPESVGIVWFGIGTLITIGNAGLETRLLICGTCDSVAGILADCMRWETRAAQANEDAPKFDIWEADIPDLIFNLLDFLWSARPHMDQSRLKRIGSSLKDLWTKELQGKVDALTEKYEEIVKLAQSHFEDSVLHENLKTGQKLDEIVADLRGYVSMGSEILDTVQRSALINELDRQKARLNYSTSHNTHYKTLSDRLSIIIQERGNRPVANWLFKEDAYRDWKSKDNETTLLCIKGPRGHGKSVAMMSAHRELRNALPRPAKGTDNTSAVVPYEPSLVCHFFFKKGDQDIQHTRTGLEAILHQLICSDEARKSIPTLIALVDVLNPSFGEAGGDSGRNGEGSGNFLDSLTNLTEAIRQIAEVIPERVYLMIDALDECQDRREQGIIQCLKNLVKSKTPGVRVIISARDNIDIESELAEPEDRNRSSTDIQPMPDYIGVIEITAEKNSRDLEEYLTHDVGAVLERRIDKHAFLDFFNSELARIVKIIHQKAKGDFTLARMIIANLKQPSKDSLEKKIQKLPTAIGDIYMASLESLTADEQELVVAALRWVVWSVSGVTVIEVSDHYREIYRDNPSIKPSEDDEEPKTINSASDQNATVIIRPTSQDPYEDPEVKDIIYHLGNAGRDFFKFDANTGLVNVDVSIREWINDDSSKTSLQESRGFNKYRDTRGNTVFKFTLTPSFVRYGDSLAKLFDEREAQMAMALDILRALNNKEFQEKFMCWDEKPEWATLSKGEKARKQRYEIDHWQNHIAALQKWWTPDCLDDPWWQELRGQLSTFMQPSNWYRWSVYRSTYPYKDQRKYETRCSARFFDEPIHVASEFGLYLIIDLLAREAGDNPIAKPHLTFSDCEKKLQSVLIATLANEDSIVFKCKNMKDMLYRVSYDITIAFLTEMSLIIFNEFGGLGKSPSRSTERGILETLEAMDPVLRVAWAANCYLREGGPIATERIAWISSSNVGGWHPDLEVDIAAFLKEYDHDKVRVAKKLQEMVIEVQKNETILWGGTIWNKPNGIDKTPLHLAAPHPPALKRLIAYGADINGKSQLKGTGGSNNLVFAILFEIIEASEFESPAVASLLKSARELVSEGAKLDMKSTFGETALHLAAQIQDLNFFKLLCLSGDWDVHARDTGKDTPMHHLFRLHRPKSEKRMKDVLEICRILLKMRRVDGDDLINAQNAFSEGPLAMAVKQGYKEAVELLIELGADVHDDDDGQRTCFHQLCFRLTHDPDIDLPILNALYNAGLDCTTVDCEGNTPLGTAISKQAWGPAEYFVEKYHGLVRSGAKVNPFFIKDIQGFTLLHRLAAIKELDEEGNAFFDSLIKALGFHVDIQQYVQERDDAGFTALHCAAVWGNFDIAKKIIAINPDLSIRDDTGYTVLDKIAENIAQESGDVAKGVATAEKKLPNAIEMFYHLLEKGTNHRLSFLETATFVKDGIDDALKSIDVSKVLSFIDQSKTDHHGWTFFDILKVNNLEHLLEGLLIPDIDTALARGLEKPNKIDLIFDGGNCTTEDGYVCRRKTEISSPDVKLKLVANHPVPLGTEKFYFEVYVPEYTRYEGDYATQRQINRRICRIGFRTILDGSWRFNLRKIVFSTSGDPERDGNKNTRFLGTAPNQSGRVNDLKLPSVIGIGYNPADNTVFFTTNGLLRSEKWEVKRRRYFPTVEVLYPTMECKVNFGQQPFKFEKANDQEWLRTGEVDATFVGITEA